MKLKVFMVMPFSNDVANNSYEHSIKPICESFDLDIRRADEIFSTRPIYDDIVKEIQDASIIIVDITGKNPNVFYELGMAHTLKQKRTIMVTKDGFTEMPFDIAHFRIIPYEDSIAGKVRFDKQLTQTLKTLLSDYKESFKDEFELTFNIFTSAGKGSDLIQLVGLKNYKGTLNLDQNLRVEGKCKNEENSYSSISMKDSFKAMYLLGYVTFENAILSLTEKGKAFVEVLIDKETECFQFNDQTFADGYTPMIERYNGKHQS